MLTRFVRIQLIVFSVAIGDRFRDAVLLSPGADPARNREDLGQLGTPCCRRALSIRERHLQGQTDRHGDIGQADDDRSRSASVFGRSTEDPRRSHRGGAQCFGDRRTVRGPQATQRISSVSRRRIRHPRDRHEDSTTRRSDAGQAQHTSGKRSRGEAPDARRRDLHRLRRCEL